MGVKKEIGNVIVFVSVFAGTLIGAGISFITGSTPGKKPGDKVSNTIQKIKKSAGDSIQTTTVKLIEKSAQLENKLKTEVDDISSLVKTARKGFKDSFKEGKERYSKSR